MPLHLQTVFVLFLHNEIEVVYSLKFVITFLGRDVTMNVMPYYCGSGNANNTKQKSVVEKKSDSYIS